MPAMLLVAATVVAGPAAANPSRSGDGTGSTLGSTLVAGGSEPSLVVALLVLAGLVAAVAAGVWWWRHLGGWTPADMTLALQATGADVERLGLAVRGLSADSPAVLAHRRALALLPTVLRRSELSDVHAALAEARGRLELTANSQDGRLERARERGPERTA